MATFNVLIENFNTHMPEKYDILGVLKDDWKHKKKKKELLNDRREIKSFIDSKLRYHFWGRCEYEFIILPWPYREKDIEEQMYKIDIYEQCKMNLDLIVDLFINDMKSK